MHRCSYWTNHFWNGEQNDRYRRKSDTFFGEGKKKNSIKTDPLTRLKWKTNDQKKERSHWPIQMKTNQRLNLWLNWLSFCLQSSWPVRFVWPNGCSSLHLSALFNKHIVYMTHNKKECGFFFFFRQKKRIIARLHLITIVSVFLWIWKIVNTTKNPLRKQRTRWRSVSAWACFGAHKKRNHWSLPAVSILFLNSLFFSHRILFVLGLCLVLNLVAAYLFLFLLMWKPICLNV